MGGPCSVPWLLCQPPPVSWPLPGWDRSARTVPRAIETIRVQGTRHPAPLRSSRVLEKIPPNGHGHPKTQLLNAVICVIRNDVSLARAALGPRGGFGAGAALCARQNSPAGIS